MEKTKEVRGITIISLVVTIVVLLILAGVSISTLVGENGVVDNAKKIQNDTYYQIASEEVNQLVLEYKLTKKDETLEEFLASKVPSRIDGVTRKDDNTLIVKKNGYEIEVEAKAESKTLTLAVVPYIGTYDGQPHDMLTSVNVSPSDAKVEYSIDNGKTYIENIPQIINASSVSVIVKASRIGYKTETVTKTAVVNKAEGKLKLSETSGTITYPNNTAFTVSENTGTLSVSSNNNNIATASVSGNTVAVKSGTTAGKATITVTSAEASNYTAKSATYEATVNNGTISLSATPYTGTYDGKAHKALTNVSVNPSDAKLEYSINGGTYSTTMPTVTNTSSFTVTVKARKEGYKTQITTETVKVSKAEGKLTLSATSGTYTYPNSGTFTVSGNTGTLSVSSNNNNIATASVSGNTVTVKSGTTAGKATITVTSAEASNYTAKSTTYTATVNNGTISLSATPYNGTYDGKAHNAITNVSVKPSDAKIEYSINGGTYSTTMPTITNVSSFTVTVRASKAGYTTKVITETTKINKASGTLKLSATSGTSTNFNNVTFSVSGNTGSLSVSSSNSKFATASIRGNTVTVKPIMAGSATITVTSAATANYTAASATYKITINGAPFTASSGVGYYTDVNSDGVADGVIFVDLKNGASGTWEGQSYNYAAVSGTKSYKIVQKNYNGPFGTKDVLQPSGSGNKRFHVMALKDVDSNKYDFWGAQSKSGNGWTVPPWSAWAAFAAKMGLSMSGSGNYGQFKMSYIYWSSESFKGMFFDQNTYGCYVRFDGNGRAAFGDGVAESNWCYVRLQTTF